MKKQQVLLPKCQGFGTVKHALNVCKHQTQPSFASQEYFGGRFNPSSSGVAHLLNSSLPLGLGGTGQRTWPRKGLCQHNHNRTEACATHPSFSPQAVSRGEDVGEVSTSPAWIVQSNTSELNPLDCSRARMRRNEPLPHCPHTLGATGCSHEADLTNIFPRQECCTSILVPNPRKSQGDTRHSTAFCPIV